MGLEPSGDQFWIVQWATSPVGRTSQMVIVSILDGDEALDATLVGGETSMVATKAQVAKAKPAMKSVTIRMAYLHVRLGLH
jgi:hypothetical protein